MPNSSICIFCGELSSGRIWITRTETGNKMNYHHCCRCRTAYPSPLPSENELAKAYSNNYYGVHEKKFGGPIELFRRVCAYSLARDLIQYISSDSRLLDIGCGAGDFLNELRKLTPAELHGMEPPGPAAQRAKKTIGIHLHITRLSESSLPDNYFELVSLRHVFEHFSDPSVALNKIDSLLKPGGHIYISIPNIESWQARLFKGKWFHLDPPRHLNLPPLETIFLALKPKGYVLIKQDHWSLEQNLYGWIQSSLNALDSKRNFLYERLKKNSHYCPERQNLHLIAQVLPAIALSPFFLIIDLLAVFFRSGATVGILFKKS
jgi:2-polyprenyl-3-methyl-5-hydroxy-6-metoxy-1,4-benzoquinol methylase